MTNIIDFNSFLKARKSLDNEQEREKGEFHINRIEKLLEELAYEFFRAYESKDITDEIYYSKIIQSKVLELRVKEFDIHDPREFWRLT